MLSVLNKLIEAIKKNKKTIDNAATVGDIILHGLEDSSPVAGKLKDVLEIIAANPPTNPIAAISDAGAIVAVFNPEAVLKFEELAGETVKSLGQKFNIPEADVASAVAALNDLMLKEFGIAPQHKEE